MPTTLLDDYSTKGSTRPDFVEYASDNKTILRSIEVKNYTILEDKLPTNLINTTVNQAIDRAKNLPPNTPQVIVIDIRGQAVSPANQSAIRNALKAGSKGAITEVRFL